MNQKDEIPMSVHKALKRFEKALQNQGNSDRHSSNEWPGLEAEVAAARLNLLAKIKKAMIDNRYAPITTCWVEV